MKVVLVVLAAICYVQAVEQPAITSVQRQWVDQEFDFHSAIPSQVHDQLLAEKFARLEKANGKNVITDSITDLLNSFREVIVNGNEVVPVLDPLEVQKIGPFDYKTTGFRVSAEVNDFRMTGLQWYTVDDVTFNALRLSFGAHATLPRIELTGNYDVNARAALLVTHNAGGLFRVFLNRIEFGVNARLGTNLFGGHLLLRELDIKLKIHDSQIRVEGMVGSNLINSAINAFIQDVSSTLIQNELEGFINELSAELHDVINDFLKNYSLADIMG